MDDHLLRPNRPSVAKLAIHRLRADRYDHDACHDPASRSGVQFGTAGTFGGANRSLSMDQAPALLRRRNRDTGCSAAIPDTGNGAHTGPAYRRPGMPNSLRRRPASAQLPRVFQLRSITLEID